MDELDRPGEIEQPRSRSPILDRGNRPPVAIDEGEDMDEVDRPANINKASSAVDDESNIEFDVVDRPSTNPLPPSVPTENEDYEILSSIVVGPDINKPKTSAAVEKDEPSALESNNSKEEEEEEMLPTINMKFDENEYFIVEKHETDLTDGPAGINNGVTANITPSTDNNTTDGPFSSSSLSTTFFSKPKASFQVRSERTDKEGITTKHTTYLPKAIDKKVKGNIKNEVMSDSFYDMNSYPRGKMTIVNVKYFQRSSGMSDYPREGTNKDADGLTELFVDLGFVVDRFDNPSKKEILAIMKAAANEDYSDKSCCACAILSHGEEGIIYGTDDFVKIKDITKLFRSRSLAGKPKFFLFQACQGSEYMNPLDSVDGPARREMTQDEMALTLPSEADFIYAYSTVPGYYSWRNSRRGSWFMEGLVSIFRENAHKMDVMRMLVRVNDVIAYRKSRTDDYKTDNKRQIASLITQMRKDFFLCPPHGPLEKKTINT